MRLPCPGCWLPLSRAGRIQRLLRPASWPVFRAVGKGARSTALAGKHSSLAYPGSRIGPSSQPLALACLLLLTRVGQTGQVGPGTLSPAPGALALLAATSRHAQTRRGVLGCTGQRSSICAKDQLVRRVRSGVPHRATRTSAIRSAPSRPSVLVPAAPMLPGGQGRAMRRGQGWHGRAARDTDRQASRVGAGGHGEGLPAPGSAACCSSPSCSSCPLLLQPGPSVFLTELEEPAFPEDGAVPPFLLPFQDAEWFEQVYHRLRSMVRPTPRGQDHGEPAAASPCPASAPLAGGLKPPGLPHGRGCGSPHSWLPRAVRLGRAKSLCEA